MPAPSDNGEGEWNRRRGGLVRGRKKRLAVFEKHDFTCAHCGFRFDPPKGYTGQYVLTDRNYRDKRGIPRVRMLEVDHIVPRLHGGTSELDNLQALCTQCNSRKGHKLP